MVQGCSGRGRTLYGTLTASRHLAHEPDAERGARPLVAAAGSAQVLVRLHVEPHREERELRARDEEQRDEDDRRRRDAVPADPGDGLDDPEREPRARHDHPERVEEDERVEVADHVLLTQPPEEALDQQPGDPRDDLADLDPRALAAPVALSR